MTKAELVEILDTYPDDTPIFDGRGHDLHARHITRMEYDDWANSTQTDDGEIPAVGIGISIGRRY